VPSGSVGLSALSDSTGFRSSTGIQRQVEITRAGGCFRSCACCHLSLNPGSTLSKRRRCRTSISTTKTSRFHRSACSTRTLTSGHMMISLPRPRSLGPLIGLLATRDGLPQADGMGVVGTVNPITLHNEQTHDLHPTTPVRRHHPDPAHSTTVAFRQAVSHFVDRWWRNLWYFACSRARRARGKISRG